MKIAQLFFPALLALLFTACKKDKEIIIPGNVAPPDSTVSNIVIETYINKSYISLLGRKPSETEYNQGYQILKTNNFNINDRNIFLDIILEKPDYFNRAYDIAKADLLNSTDSTEINSFINVFEILLNDTSYKSFWPELTMEKQRLEDLKSAPLDFQAGLINMQQLHRRCVNNYIYDQINMGTENFVVSNFQHFLFRYPTNAELESGKKMVDGFSSYLFYEQGKTKDDFIDIFLRSDNYMEGQVRDLYQRYLFREATPEEMHAYTIEYKNSGSYKTLQKNIMSSNEYTGLPD